MIRICSEFVSDGWKRLVCKEIAYAIWMGIKPNIAPLGVTGTYTADAPRVSYQISVYMMSVFIVQCS